MLRLWYSEHSSIEAQFIRLKSVRHLKGNGVSLPSSGKLITQDYISRDNDVHRS